MGCEFPGQPQRPETERRQASDRQGIGQLAKGVTGAGQLQVGHRLGCRWGACENVSGSAEGKATRSGSTSWITSPEVSPGAGGRGAADLAWDTIPSM